MLMKTFKQVHSVNLFLFQPIHRKERKFNRLVIPRKLAKELPFKYRPKQSLRKDGLTIAGTRAVIREPHERKVSE